MNPDVLKVLEDLEKTEQDLIRCGKDMIENSDLYQFDLLVSAVLNRTLALMNGFRILILNNNYICAAHLVRLHLDSLLRLSAAWLVDDPQELSGDILKGTSLRKIRDRENNLLTDKYLVGKLLPKYPWIQSVYDATCGYVHLSNKHMMVSARVKKATRTMEVSISTEERFIDDVYRIEGIMGMIKISECIIEFVNAWIYKKRNKNST